MKEHIIDAKGKIFGRIASEIAMILTGKNSVLYRQNVVPSVAVKVYNTDALKISGRKLLQKMYYRHSGRIGNLKEETLGNLMKRDSRRVVELAVFGMLPKNRLRKEHMKHISFYKGQVPQATARE